MSTGFDAPGSVAEDSSGNLIVCDTSHSAIDVLAEVAENPGYTIGGGAQWQVGSLYVIAGGGSTTPSASGAPALSTLLSQPGAVAVDPFGNILIADTQDDNVSVLAVSSNNPGYDVTSWTRGDMYLIAGNQTSTPAPTASGGGASATTFGLNRPNGLGIDARGNVVIDDTSANLVALVAVSASNPGFELASGSSWTPGDLYVIAGGGGGTDIPSFNGVSAPLAELNSPEGVAVDEAGNPVFADSNNNELDVIAESSVNPGYPTIGSWSRGYVYAIVGGGSNSPSASGVAPNATYLGDPVGVALDQSGDVIFTYGAASAIGLLSMSNTDPGYAIGSMSSWSSDEVFRIAGGGSEPPTSTGTEAISTQLNVPAGLSVLPSGAVVVADTGNWLIEELDLAPSPPSLSQGTAGDGSVSLSWSAPSRNGGAPVSDYEVLVSDDSGALQRSIDVGSTVTSYVVGGLNDGARYSFEVEAVNSIGTSAPSAALSAVPNGPGATTLPPPPVSLPVPTSVPPTTIAPGSGHAHHTTTGPLATVHLVTRVASVRYGFTTLVVRCTASRCTGTLRLVGKRVVHFAQHGIEKAVTETYLASSDHFDLHGRRNVSVLVPIGSQVLAWSKTRPLVVTAEFSVAHGRSAHYRLVLSPR